MRKPVRPLTFRISTARNKMKCQGVVRIKCIIESSGKKASVLNDGHWSLLLIANDAAMQITSQCFRLFCSPLPTLGLSLWSLNQEKESVLPGMHRGPNSQARCELTDSRIAEISCWATGREKILRNLILDECRALLFKATLLGWWGGSRIIIGQGVYQGIFSVLTFPSFCLSEDFGGGAVPLLHSLYRQDEGFVILRVWTNFSPCLAPHYTWWGSAIFLCVYTRPWNATLADVCSLAILRLIADVPRVHKEQNRI